MKTLSAFILLFLGMGFLAHAGAEGKTTADPVFDDTGNTWRIRPVTQSTITPVTLSSAPALATPISFGDLEFSSQAPLGIMTWRSREIVNVSTCCNLALYPTNNFQTFSATAGVVLSSDPTGRGLGDSYQISHQDTVWGIWSPWSVGCPTCAAGAVVTESYWSDIEDIRRRR